MKLYLLFALICLSTTPSLALEQEPFLGWLEDIEDASSEVNAYFNSEAKKTLHEINNEPNSSNYQCYDVVYKILKHQFNAFYIERKIRRFVYKNEKIDKWNQDGYWKRVWNSPYRYTPQLYITSLNYVINMNGIYMGFDKIGHMFSFGRRYLRKYQKARSEGFSHKQAASMAILWGIYHERGITGGIIDGIVSYADLEANYQGFLMAKDLCDNSQPALQKNGDTWSWEKFVNLNDYITPSFDEGYNNSRFAWPYWIGVKKRMKNFCYVLDNPKVQKRLHEYKLNDQKNENSLFRKIIKEQEKEFYLKQKDFSLIEVCR